MRPSGDGSSQPGLSRCYSRTRWGTCGQRGLRGLPVSAPAFIPFLGAFITMKEMPPDVETEAYVAYGGPFIGTLATFACYFWARETDDTLLLAVSYSGFFLNLFNLLPVSPLDGGRITAVLGPRIWFVGVPLLIGFFIVRPSATLVIIGLLALPHLLQAWRHDPQAPENLAYYAVPPRVKFEYMVLYLGLAVILALMTDSVHTMLDGVRAAR